MKHKKLERLAASEHDNGRYSDGSIKHGLYFNREVNWLEFNRRVLEEAQDENQPATGTGEVRGNLRFKSGRVLYDPGVGAERTG